MKRIHFASSITVTLTRNRLAKLFLMGNEVYPGYASQVPNNLMRNLTNAYKNIHSLEFSKRAWHNKDTRGNC